MKRKVRCLVQDAVDTSAVTTRLCTLSNALPYFFKHVITLCLLISFLAHICLLKKIIKNVTDFLISLISYWVSTLCLLVVCVCVCVYVRQVLLRTWNMENREREQLRTWRRGLYFLGRVFKASSNQMWDESCIVRKSYRKDKAQVLEAEEAGILLEYTSTSFLQYSGQHCWSMGNGKKRSKWFWACREIIAMGAHCGVLTRRLI